MRSLFSAAACSMFALGYLDTGAAFGEASTGIAGVLSVLVGAGVFFRRCLLAVIEWSMTVILRVVSLFERNIWDFERLMAGDECVMLFWSLS